MKQTEKLGADCTKELMKKIKGACEKERRTIANFIRFSCEERANKILGVCENAKK